MVVVTTVWNFEVNLLTVLVSAPTHEELQSLIDFVEEYLKVE